MINFDYKIVRDEGDEEKLYKPDAIPTKLENITYIEGPNSSGKSTLLNIIALGFYGEKKDSLNVALKDKLRGLVNSHHQNLTFSLEISNKDGSLKLISEKTNPNKPDIIVREISKEKGERKISRETFEREYNLIYDIPDNPTERLNQLIFDIKDEQVRYGNLIGALKETTRRMIAEIRSARDPERIQFLVDQLKKAKRDLEISTNHLKNLEHRLDMVESYVYWRLYQEYSNKHAQLSGKIDDLTKKAIKVQKRVDRGGITYTAELRAAQRIIQDMQTIFDTITSLLNLVLNKDEKFLIEVWERIDLNRALNELQFDDQLEQSLIHFKKITDEKLYELDKDSSSREADLYYGLIRVLEAFKDLKLTIPGMEKTVKEFIADLKSAAEKYDSMTKFKDNANELVAELNKLEIRLGGLNNVTFAKLRNLKQTLPLDEQEVVEISQDHAKEEFLREVKKCKEKLDLYETEYAAKGKPSEKAIFTKWPEAKKYEVYKEDQLLTEIAKTEKDIVQESANNKDIDHRFHCLTSELDKLKEKKQHKYQDKLYFLEELFLKLPLLENKLMREYRVFVTDIIERKSPSSGNKEQEQYNDAVFSFLANKIGRFLHDRNEYKAVKVDLIKGIISTDTKKIIHLQDMGTGHGQSAYLKGRLNTSDKRKIIALFDEVAMMDNKSLEPIYNRFRELYKEGKLLVGIVVQRGDEVKVLAKGK